MAMIYLSGGTDVAEMALFDADALPRRLPRGIEDLAPLSSQEQLVHFPTGADGGYLLHLFVNETIPASTMRYCLADDKLNGNFYTSTGRIAFGGLESIYAEFKPNPNIRADGLIEPGRYVYTAYRTDFPGELVQKAIELAQTTGPWWLGRAPVIATLIQLAMTLALVIAGKYLAAGAIFLSARLVRKWLQRLPEYQRLMARIKQAQLVFPSIVVELRSNPSCNAMSVSAPNGRTPGRKLAGKETAPPPTGENDHDDPDSHHRRRDG